MMDLRPPRFDWGLSVLARDDILNDGTYPGEAEQAVLVPKDSPGEIVRVGHHEESNMPLYLVEFANGKVVGCLEEEIVPSGKPRA
ncbi:MULTISPECIES: nitrogen fixation protein NifZ [Acidithiobacillus]|jgi:nitrogen fixation protein NifZ|uniref:Nitrogen fixation protein NifZ n=2 Tax=Acidithiobacillus ferridurans TaxID=1232575 RepID=A0A8X8GAA1_ACIFI|nr:MULTISPECIES: nitrogen fixation protein NifZ [Acidithiobacillus]MBU2715404.1 nitrogen fixation protein NifZ [Acidithiobacillus ferridurans]MBU2719937.1 nitrogen fixation protein NifZ [Acidithiobacillus ferridurans]MBU2722140.1 nitrogen fixation protein NifZ [Acidithiobacillus ferridurans]MBU2726350.1 nitrogen fixation protein NifZ [Acidithiobacillus ferridurans]MBU2804785.1 nitrogen fixation protein NifZ [Acidithiobacillus ferridurans]